jgi:RNA polymerase sigma-70 factor (ECF subfamily)
LADLFRTAYRLCRQRADADDLLQDTCVAACEQIEVLERAEHPRRWLLRVLYNRFVDGARRKKRSPVVTYDDTAAAPAFPSSEPTPEESLQSGEAAQALQRAFLQLDETQRALLALRAEGYGLPEIAAITGVGTEVLRARLQRARKSLARHLERTNDTGPVAHIGSKR